MDRYFVSYSHSKGPGSDWGFGMAIMDVDKSPYTDDGLLSLQSRLSEGCKGHTVLIINWKKMRPLKTVEGEQLRTTPPACNAAYPGTGPVVIGGTAGVA